jgi:phospholipid/cholesterol/gamma-HCH transport system substrate-binding protein
MSSLAGPWRLLHSLRGNPFRIGLVIIAVALALAVPLFAKAQIGTLLTPGRTLTVHLAADHDLKPYRTDVKVAGVPVGKVLSVAEVGGGAEVIVKLDSDAYAALGTAPSAAVRPTTMLGGRYYLDLVPGGPRGEPAGDIPVGRTHRPVELEQVAAAIQPDAQAGARHAVASLDATLTAGDDALRRLLADAPGTLTPAAGVLQGFRGDHPDEDLPKLVGNLEATARVLTERQGQLSGTVTDLAAVSAVFDRRAGDLAAAVGSLPAALDSADTGLDALRGSLAKIRETAGPARRVVASLGDVLDTADPTIAEARPVVADLRAAVADLRPTIGDLVPTASDLADTSDNLGSVLDRIDGPIRDTVFSPFTGTGPYAGNGAAFPLYQAIGYMFSNLNRSARYTDPNGSVVSLQFGGGPGSLVGLPIPPNPLPGKSLPGKSLPGASALSQVGGR